MMSERYAARVAGFMFLFVIATVLTSGILLSGVDSDDIAGTLRDISEYEVGVRLSVVLFIIGGISTLILAAALYAMTRREDGNLAILALACRSVEAGLYAVGIVGTLTLVSLSEGGSSAPSGDVAAIHTLGDAVADVDAWATNVGAIFFAAGSALFAYLLLKARSIPTALAVLGLIASLILVVGVTIQTAAGKPTADDASGVIWVPMIVFEIATGIWLLIKGANVGVERGDQEVEA